MAIETAQSPVTGCATVSKRLLPAGPTGPIRNHLKLKVFWLEITGTPTKVSLRWGQNGNDLFSKTQTGLAGLNLIEAGMQVISPANTELWIHIEGTCTVCYTIVFEYI